MSATLSIRDDTNRKQAYRTLPPLENGDHLTRDEFERRYMAMPHLKKAELIEGKVYVSSPVLLTTHGKPHALLIAWIVAYAAATPGVEYGDNATVRLSATSEPQPDACLLLRPEYGGQARIGESGYVEGAPELVIEVASSSASYDLHSKYQAYEAAGVREYIVWRTRDFAVDWFVLEKGTFTRAEHDDGVYRSMQFPGLLLDARALLDENARQVLAALNQALATEDHAAFVDELKRRFAEKGTASE